MIIDDQLFYNLVFNFEMQKLASTDDQLRANLKLIDRLIFAGFYFISYLNLTRVYLCRQITHSGRQQGCIFRLTCSYPELTKDHVLTSAYMLTFLEPSREMP